MVITIYGPYDIWLSRLRLICKYLRETHGFQDSFPVMDRGDFRNQNELEADQVYEMRKSYYFLELSHVNVFVFYCKAHSQSADIEFKHVCDNLPQKISNSIVMRDSSCNMGRLFEGEIIHHKIRCELFNGRSVDPERDISELVNAFCLSVLKREFYNI